MSKNIMLIVGIILTILGILALIPMFPWAVMWFAIVILVIGIASIVLSVLEKRRTS